MVAVHTIKRRTKTAEVKHGPAQPPVEALAGTAFTRDVLENFERDPLGRDVFRVRARLQEWDETEELHRRNRDAPIPIEGALVDLHLPPYGIHVLGAEMGEGKSITAAVVARCFYRAGWPV